MEDKNQFRDEAKPKSTFILKACLAGIGLTAGGMVAHRFASNLPPLAYSAIVTGAATLVSGLSMSLADRVAEARVQSATDQISR